MLMGELGIAINGLLHLLQVGWDIKEKSGKKKVVLELGGNAACIIEVHL